MSVYKKIDVVGTSGTSVSDAIRGAVKRAAVTIEDLEWFEVKEIRGRLKQGEVEEFQVSLSLGFLLHAPKEETGDVGTARQDNTRPAKTRQTRSMEAQVAARAGERAKKGVARNFREQPGKTRG